MFNKVNKLENVPRNSVDHEHFKKMGKASLRF